MWDDVNLCFNSPTSRNSLLLPPCKQVKNHTALLPHALAPLLQYMNAVSSRSCAKAMISRSISSFPARSNLSLLKTSNPLSVYLWTSLVLLFCFSALWFSRTKLYFSCCLEDMTQGAVLWTLPGSYAYLFYLFYVKQEAPQPRSHPTFQEYGLISTWICVELWMNKWIRKLHYQWYL